MDPRRLPAAPGRRAAAAPALAPYLLACAIALLGWLVAGPLEAAPASGAAPATGTGTGPAASAAAASQPDVETVIRRCREHPVRAVRDECIASARRRAGAPGASAPGPR